MRRCSRDGDADAVVLNDERRTLAVSVARTTIRSVSRVVLHRVVQQVDERRDQRVGVREHRRQAPVRRRPRECTPGTRSRRPSTAAFDDGGWVEPRRTRTANVALEAREREEVLDQAGQARVLARQQLQILARLRRIELTSASSPSTRTRIEASGVRSSCDTAATRSVFSRASRSCRRSARPAAAADDGHHHDSADRDADVQNHLTPGSGVERRHVERLKRQLPARASTDLRRWPRRRP